MRPDLHAEVAFRTRTPADAATVLEEEQRELAEDWSRRTWDQQLGDRSATLVSCGASWMFFSPRCPVAFRHRVGLAHVRASFRVPVVLRAGKMIDLRLCVYPHDRCAGTASLCTCLGREMVCA